MSRHRITRRTFLGSATLGFAGLAVGGDALAQMGGGGMGGTGTTVIDPPRGAALVEPPLADLRTATSEYLVDVRQTSQTVAGSRVSLLTYNERFVAPTILASRGQVVRLRLKNNLPSGSQTNYLGHPRYVTNLHVHGWHVSPEGISDNVHLRVSQGGEQPYEYDLRLQRPGMIGLYHPHVHGSVAEQMWGGLVGALKVEDGVTLDYPEHLLVLKDITLSAGAPAPYTMMSDYMRGKQGNLILVNGQVNPVLTIQPGQVKRLRVLNASNARFYRLTLQGHTLHVIGSDGGLLDKPYPVSEVLMAPGERVDLLVQASTTTGYYKLLSLPYARQGNMASEQITLLTLQVTGSKVSQAIPAVIDASATSIRNGGAVAKQAQFTLSMNMGRGYINGQSFETSADGHVLGGAEHHSMVGTHEVWEIINNSGMDHPWHQHVNDAQVLSITGGDATFAPYARLYTAAPAWKDTVIVPKWGRVTLRIPIQDHTGMAMFHCHILEHEDIGMMGMWHIM